MNRFFCIFLFSSCVYFRFSEFSYSISVKYALKDLVTYACQSVIVEYRNQDLQIDGICGVRWFDILCQNHPVYNTSYTHNEWVQSYGNCWMCKRPRVALLSHCWRDLYWKNVRISLRGVLHHLLNNFHISVQKIDEKGSLEAQKSIAEK